MEQKVYLVYQDGGSREDWQPLYISNSKSLAEAWMKANQYDEKTEEGYFDMYVFQSVGEFI